MTDHLVKAEAVRLLGELGVCEPYLLDFQENDQVYLFDKGEGRRIDPNSILYKKLKAIEEKSNVKIYAVIHSIIDYIGPNYSFLCVSPYSEDWAHQFHKQRRGGIIANAYVWNVSREECSEFGYIAVDAAFGKLRRVG
ncbi:MAG: hypothetical protein HDT28_01970 [Clostridiales bacterium]|nr:hypothetical protein [Clostridiales bacterium]